MRVIFWPFKMRLHSHVLRPAQDTGTLFTLDLLNELAF